jgi:hypothetical protein
VAPDPFAALLWEFGIDPQALVIALMGSLMITSGIWAVLKLTKAAPR